MSHSSVDLNVFLVHQFLINLGNVMINQNQFISILTTKSKL